MWNITTNAVATTHTAKRERPGRPLVPVRTLSRDGLMLNLLLSDELPMGKRGALVTRLAVELRLWNRGTRPWTPANAQLVGQGRRWDVQV